LALELSHSVVVKNDVSNCKPEVVVEKKLTANTNGVSQITEILTELRILAILDGDILEGE